MKLLTEFLAYASNKHLPLFYCEVFFVHTSENDAFLLENTNKNRYHLMTTTKIINTRTVQSYTTFDVGSKKRR